MDIENTDQSSNEITEVKKSAVKHLVRRFLVVLGITLVVGFVMTWFENRYATSDDTDISA